MQKRWIRPPCSAVVSTRYLRRNCANTPGIIGSWNYITHLINHGFKSLVSEDLHSPRTFNLSKVKFDFIMFTVVILDSVEVFSMETHYTLSFGNKFIDGNLPRLVMLEEEFSLLLG